MCIVDNNDKQFKQLIQDVTEIKNALLGSDYNQLGIIKRVEVLEKEMLNLNVIKWKITGAAMTVATISSVVVSIILKFIIHV